MKPWISRRLDYGHYDRLMRELEAKCGVIQEFCQDGPSHVQRGFA